MVVAAEPATRGVEAPWLPHSLGGCHSGTSSGLVGVDDARCVVVELWLEDNNLVGTLPEGLAAGVPQLQRLSVRDNHGLSGTLPGSLVSLGALRELELRGNGFEYDEDDNALSRHCRSAGIACNGVPPNSCEAFGADYAVGVDNPEICIHCGSVVAPLIVIGVVVGLVIVVIAVYIRVATRNPDATKRWVSTICIFIAHFQTIKIVTTMQLPWPPNVVAVGSATGADIFAIELPGANPACLIASFGEDDSVYVALTLCKLATLLAINGLPYLLALWRERSGRRASARALKLSGGAAAADVPGAMAAAEAAATRHYSKADAMHFATTICVQFTFGTAWQVALKTLYLHSPTRVVAYSSTDAVIYAFALWLMALLTYLCVLYRCKIHVWHLQTGYTPLGSRPRLDDSFLIRPLLRTASERHELQLRFLTGRFAPHAPFWQYVIWGRAIGLILTTAIPLTFTPETEDTEVIGRASSAAVYATTLIHIVLAAAIVAVSWWATWRTDPYVYRFQNALDKALVGSVLLLLLLGGTYTFATDHAAHGDALLVEALMLALMGGVMVASFVYLIYVWRVEGWKKLKGLSSKLVLSIKVAASGRLSAGSASGGGGRGGGRSVAPRRRRSPRESSLELGSARSDDADDDDGCEAGTSREFVAAQQTKWAYVSRARGALRVAELFGIDSGPSPCRVPSQLPSRKKLGAAAAATAPTQPGEQTSLDESSPRRSSSSSSCATAKRASIDPMASLEGGGRTVAFEPSSFVASPLTTEPSVPEGVEKEESDEDPLAERTWVRSSQPQRGLGAVAATLGMSRKTAGRSAAPLRSIFSFSRKVKADEKSDSPRHSDADGAASVAPRPALSQSPSVMLEENSPSDMMRPSRVSKATRRKARKESMQGDEGVTDLCSPKDRPVRHRRQKKQLEPTDSVQLTDGLQAIQGSAKI